MTLPLYFRPEDPYCHPVVGNRTRAKKLAVRLRRSADGEVSAAVIGVVKSEYRCVRFGRIEQVVRIRKEGSKSNGC